MRRTIVATCISTASRCLSPGTTICSSRVCPAPSLDTVRANDGTAAGTTDGIADGIRGLGCRARAAHAPTAAPGSVLHPVPAVRCDERVHHVHDRSARLEDGPLGR